MAGINDLQNTTLKTGSSPAASQAVMKHLLPFLSQERNSRQENVDAQG